MTTTYRYLFAGFLTNKIVAKLPITGVSFTQELNQDGKVFPLDFKVVLV